MAQARFAVNVGYRRVRRSRGLSLFDGLRLAVSYLGTQLAVGPAPRVETAHSLASARAVVVVPRGIPAPAHSPGPSACIRGQASATGAKPATSRIQFMSRWPSACNAARLGPAQAEHAVPRKLPPAGALPGPSPCKGNDARLGPGASRAGCSREAVDGGALLAEAVVARRDVSPPAGCLSVSPLSPPPSFHVPRSYPH
jgi:hypothetical protein